MACSLVFANGLGSGKVVVMSDQSVILVTGAARRVGAVIVRELHERGHRVVVHYRASQSAANALVAELNANRPNSAHALQADCDDMEAVQQLALAAVSCFGRLDGLVNNASCYFPVTFGEATLAKWDALFNSNARAAYFLSEALAPALRQTQGAIVNITDARVLKNRKGYVMYSAAKAALMAMSDALAQELSPDVRVMSVAPGPVMFPEGAASMSDADKAAAFDNLPEDVLRTPQAVAEAVCIAISGRAQSY